MKKFTKLTAAVLAAAIVFSANGPVQARAENTAQQPNTQEGTADYASLSYDAVKPVELTPGEIVTFQVEKVDYKFCYFTFTLTETSKVDINSTLQGSSASSLSWDYTGNVYSDPLCSKRVADLNAVDAGTYYVRFSCTPNYLRDDQTLSVCVSAVSYNWGEGKDGKTLETAIPLTVGKDCELYVNEKKTTRYTKFTLENDTVLTVQGRSTTLSGYQQCYMSVYDSKGVNITGTAADESKLPLTTRGEWTEAYKITLAAGTYYLGVTYPSDTAYASDFTFRTEILKETDNTPPAKPTKLVYKAGTTKVTGKGENSAYVFVRVNDTIYTGKVTSKGTFSVKTAKLVKGDVVYVWLMDKSLNQGKYSKVTVK